jgi:hypothetical protein
MRVALLIASTSILIQGQSTPAPDGQSVAKGIPPRASAGDYLSNAQAGSVTIAAEFTGHSIPTLEGPLTTEDFVAVETALYGPPGARLVISAGDFSLRLNGKKAALPSQPYGLLASSLKDPEWVPPEAPAAKSKTSMTGGGQGQGEPNTPPPPVVIPVPVQRAMAKRVQQASLPEGDRALPQAGLIYFRHRGKTENLQSVELIYEGPAGKAILKLQP